MNFLKRPLVALVEKIHLKLFGHEIGQEMKVFIVNLFWSIFGGGLAAVCVLAVNIIAGRLMGPAQYGQYSLVLVIVSYCLVPIYFGLDLASVRAIAKSKDSSEIGQNISSATLFVVSSSIIVLGLVYIFRQPVAHLFSTNATLVRYSIYFTVFLVAKNILDCFVRGVKLFKYQFLGRIVETVVIVFVFGVMFIVLKRNVYSSYLVVLAIGALSIVFFYLIRLRHYFGGINIQKLRSQLSYGKLFVLTATLSTIFVSLDKLMINRYLTVYDLGLYGAYFTASVTLVTQVTQMFNNVFFPSIAKNMSKEVFDKTEKLLRLGSVPLLALITLAVFVMLKLFGSKYTLNLSDVLVFGLLGTTQVVVSIYYSIILTQSKAIYKKQLIYSNLINLATVGAYAILIFSKHVSILLIALTLCFNYLAVILIQRSLIKRSFSGKV